MSEHGKQCRTYYRDQLTGEGPKLVWDCRCPLGMSGQPARTELDDLRAQVATLRAALQYAEWSDRNSHCFDCERFIEDGHAPDCSLQVLSSTEAAALAHEARIWNRAIDAVQAKVIDAIFDMDIEETGGPYTRWYDAPATRAKLRDDVLERIRALKRDVPPTQQSTPARGEY